MQILIVVQFIVFSLEHSHPELTAPWNDFHDDDEFHRVRD